MKFYLILLFFLLSCGSSSSDCEKDENGQCLGPGYRGVPIPWDKDEKKEEKPVDETKPVITANVHSETDIPQKTLNLGSEYLSYIDDDGKVVIDGECTTGYPIYMDKVYLNEKNPEFSPTCVNGKYSVNLTFDGSGLYYIWQNNKMITRSEILGIKLQTACYGSEYNEIGSGAEQDPFVICDKKQLRDLRYKSDINYNDFLSDNDSIKPVYAILMNDIDFEGESVINGLIISIDFNGNGHKLSNMNNIYDDFYRRMGMLGCLVNSHIYDLTIENYNATFGSHLEQEAFGILAGTTEKSTVHNVHVSGNITVNKDTSYNSIGIGGLIGQADDTNISNSSFTGNIHAEGGTNIGGLIGSFRQVDVFMDEPTITNSTSAGEVSGANSVGALIGYLKDGIVSATTSSTSIVTENAGGELTSDVGGFVGTNDGGVIE